MLNTAKCHQNLITSSVHQESLHQFPISSLSVVVEARSYKNVVSSRCTVLRRNASYKTISRSTTMPTSADASLRPLYTAAMIDAGSRCPPRRGGHQTRRLALGSHETIAKPQSVDNQGTCCRCVWSACVTCNVGGQASCYCVRSYLTAPATCLSTTNNARWLDAIC